MTYEEMFRIYLGIFPPKEDITCNICIEKDKCDYAWDEYNLENRCLVK